nr:hypothetical protein [Enterococcus faecium]
MVCIANNFLYRYTATTEIFTNIISLSLPITIPTYVEKEYLAEVSGIMTEEDIRLFAKSDG